MDMGTPAGAFKEAADKNFAIGQNNAADRAYPLPFSVEAVNAAFYVHKPVFSAVQGGKGNGLYQFTFLKLCRTGRTGLGFSGEALCPGPEMPVSADAASASPDRNAYAEKQGITEPKQSHAQKYKNKDFKKLHHP